MENFALLAKKYNALVYFSEYMPNDPKMDIHYKNMAVFKETHKNFNEFVTIVQRLEKDERCLFSLNFRNLKKTNLMKRIKNYFFMEAK
jgi:hypothetical protein